MATIISSKLIPLAGAAVALGVGAGAALATAHAVNPASAPTACTASEQTAARKALGQFQRTAATRQKAYFRTHTGRRARAAYLRHEKARLRALKLAAACSVVVTPPAAHVIAQIPVTQPGSMAFSSDGGLWVNRAPYPGSAPVSLIEPNTNQVTATVAVGDPSIVGGGTAIAYGFGSIWEVDWCCNTVTRIDPQTHAVLAVIPTQGPSPAGIVVTPTSIWVANHNEPATTDGPSIVQVDPATNSVVRKILLGNEHGGPVWLSYASGSIWAQDFAHSDIARVDPATGTVIASIHASAPIPGMIAPFATDGTQVWFSFDNDLLRIDPTTNDVNVVTRSSAFTRYGLTDTYSVIYADGTLWLDGPCAKTSCLFAVDPTSGAITKAWTLPPVKGDVGDLVYGDGSLWVGAGDNPHILRIDPNG